MSAFRFIQPRTIRGLCGISAIVDFGASGRTVGDLVAMHGRIAHRGPDGDGFLLADASLTVQRGEALTPLAERVPAPRLAMGFRWLAIMDLLPEAAQPMANAAGDVWVVFNGEIYNFVELREELIGRGHRFRTAADTEVILAAYEEWGRDCLGHFEGMWAILIVDLRRRRLFGSRDRFGIKPLFYTIDKQRLLFASEIKQLLAATGGGAMNPRYVHDYLNGTRAHLDDDTFYAGIQMVPAASRFEIDLDANAPRIEFETWWDLSRFARMPRMRVDEESAARGLDDVLRQAVSRHACAAVKVGTLLSGGLDSTLLTGMLHDLDEPHESYSIVFDRERYAAFDESPFIDAFLRHRRVPNHRATFDAKWLREQLPALTWTQDEPLIATTLFAQSRAFALASEREAVVVLDGQGSDEVFGGYPSHEYERWRERLMTGDVAGFLAEGRILARGRNSSAMRLWWELARVTGGALARRLGMRHRYPWLDDAYFGATSRSAVEDERRREIARWPSRLERMLYSEIRYTSLPQLLLFSDRAAMAHSLEARLPFLDHRVVEYAAQLPPELKTGLGIRKRLLRHVARRYLPDAVVDRPDKMGFVTPESLWLRTDLRDDVLALGRNRALRAMPFLRMSDVATFAEDYVAGRHRDFRAVWRLLAFSRWLEAYGLV